MMIERRLYKCCTELNEFSNHHRYTSCKDYYKDTLLSVRSNSGVRHIKCCSGAVLVLCFLDSTSGRAAQGSGALIHRTHMGWGTWDGGMEQKRFIASRFILSQLTFIFTFIFLLSPVNGKQLNCWQFRHRGATPFIH
jgi:hypothetical protein